MVLFYARILIIEIIPIHQILTLQHLQPDTLSHSNTPASITEKLNRRRGRTLETRCATTDHKIIACPAPISCCCCCMTVFSGWKLCSLPPDVWNVKPLSAALWRCFQEHADGRPGHNAELLARDPWAEILGKAVYSEGNSPPPSSI